MSRGGGPEGMGSATGTLQGVLEEKGVCMERGPTGYSPASWDLPRGASAQVGGGAIAAPEGSPVSEASCVRGWLSDPSLGDLPPEPPRTRLFK